MDATLLKALVIKQLDVQFSVQTKEVYEYLGVLKGAKVGDGISTSLPAKIQKHLKLSARASGVSYFFAVAAIFTVVNLYTTGNLGLGGGGQPLNIGVAATLGATLFAVTVVLPLKDVSTIYKKIIATELTSIPAIKTILRGNGEIIGSTKWVRAAGLFFDVGLPWGLALYDILSNHLEPGSTAFNTVIAGAVASTIVAILLFALSASVIGTLITIVLSFVDLFLTLLCKANVAGTCWGIVSTVTDALAKFIYSGNSTIDFDHKDSNGRSDLISIEDITSDVANPNLGLRAGNNVTYQIRDQDHDLPEIGAWDDRRYVRSGRLLWRGRPAPDHISLLANDGKGCGSAHGEPQ